MAKVKCPCCGMKAPFGRNGTADQATAVKMLNDDLREAAAKSAALTDEDRTKLEAFIRGGEEMSSFLVDHVHKRAKAGRTPDLLALGHKQREYMETGMGLLIHL